MEWKWNQTEIFKQLVWKRNWHSTWTKSANRVWHQIFNNNRHHMASKPKRILNDPFQKASTFAIQCSRVFLFTTRKVRILRLNRLKRFKLLAFFTNPVSRSDFASSVETFNRFVVTTTGRSPAWLCRPGSHFMQLWSTYWTDGDSNFPSKSENRFLPVERMCLILITQLAPSAASRFPDPFLVWYLP